MRQAWRRGRRDPLVWVFILTAVLAVIGVFDMAREIGQPFGGYVSYRRAAVPTGEVDINTPIWWPGMLEDRLRYDVTLLAAGGRAYYPYAREVFAAAAAEGRLQVPVTVLDGKRGETETRELPVERFSVAQFTDIRLPDLIMALVFWLLAIVVYVSDPADPTNRAFALVMSLVGLLRAIYVHNLFLDDTLSVLVEILLLLLIPILGASLIYLAWKFPVPAGPHWRAPVIIAMAAAMVVAVPAVLARLPGLPEETARLFGEVNYYGIVALFSLGVLALAGRLTWRLARRRQLNRRERRILTFVLVGLGLSLPMLFVTIFSWVTINGRQLTYYLRGFDVRYLALAVPLFFAYALVRYRSMRSPSLLFIFMMVLSSSAIVAAFGAWVWTWGHPDWPDNGLRPPFTTLFVAGLVSSLVWGGAASARGAFGRMFHFDQQVYGAARDFGRRITDQADLIALPAKIVAALVEEFRLERAAIWLRDAAGNDLALAGQHGHFRLSPPATLVPDEALLRRAGAPLRIDRPEGVPQWLRPLASEGCFVVAVPLVSGGDLVGLMALGPRWDEAIFDGRDLVVAELIGQQATLFLVAAAGMDELRRVPGRMAEVQDRERGRMAQELHDTVQQFLGRLPFYLAYSRDKVHSRPDEVREILDRTISDVENAAAAVRQIRHNLAPSQLESGLSSSLAALVHHFQQRTAIQVGLTLAPELDERTTVGTRHAIYRVIQQSLDNVEAHAMARTVTIEATVRDGRVAFSVRDDGCGSSAPQRLAARQRGSFGIESMRARLEASGGEFRIVSEEGKGTAVYGWVPAAS